MPAARRPGAASGGPLGSAESGKVKMIVLGIAALVTLLALGGTVLMDLSAPLPTSDPTGVEGASTPRIERPVKRKAKRTPSNPESHPGEVLSG